MIKLEITSENVQEFFQELSQLLAGAGNLATVNATEPETKKLSKETVKEEPLKEAPSEEVKETKEEKSPREKAAEKKGKAELKKETATKKEVGETPKEEEPIKEAPAKKEEEEAPKEEAPKEGGKYTGDLSGCKSKEDVISKVRELVAEMVEKGGDQASKVKELFSAYKVPTVIRLSEEQAVEFYEKLSKFK